MNTLVKRFWSGVGWGSLAFAAGLLFMRKLAYGADPVATVPIEDWLSQALTLGRDWKTMGTWVALAGLVNLLLNATKTQLLGGLFHKLTASAQMWLLLGLSTLSAGLTVAAKGGGIVDVISAVIQSASGAMLLHELFKRLRPKPAALAPVTDVVSKPEGKA